jgi:transcriptional regulator with XRE-family HTH domain
MSYVVEGSVPEWSLGDRLAKARRFAGLEQSDLADEWGLSSQVISKYERDKSVPKRVIIKAWALKTGVPLSWLLDEFQPPPDGLQGNGKPAGYTGRVVALFRSEAA